MFVCIALLTGGLGCSYAQETATPQAKKSQKVYKNVGPNGEVIFSDKPSPGSKEITVPTNKGYKPVPPPAGFIPYVPETPKKRAITNRVTITSPTEEQTIRNATGEVNVSVSVSGQLRGDQRLEYVIDGKTVYSGTQTSHRFSNVYRGAHVLKVRLTDNSGSIESSPVTFYMHRPFKRQAPLIKHKKTNTPTP